MWDKYVAGRVLLWSGERFWPTSRCMHGNRSQPQCVTTKHSISRTLASCYVIARGSRLLSGHILHTGYHQMCPDRSTIWWQPGAVTDRCGGPDAHKVVLKTRRLHGEMRPTAKSNGGSFQE